MSAITLPLFPEAPRPAPPPRQEKPKPPPYVPDTAAAEARARRILAVLPGTVADVIRRAGMPLLTQSATVADLIMMTSDHLVVRSNDPEPIYSLPEKS